MRPNAPPNSPDHDDGIIVPVDFTPLDGKHRGDGPRLSPVRIAVGIALAGFVGAGWFVLTARSVFFDVSPPGIADIELDGNLAMRIGPRYLMREGPVQLSVRAPGYYDYAGELTISEQQAQTFALELTPLPGFLNLDTGAVTDAEVFIDGESIGRTPLSRLEVAAGEHTITVRKDRFEEFSTDLSVEGRSQEQALSVELLPAWANLSFSTTPPGATVTIDGIEVGTTPLRTEVLEGQHELIVKLPAHKAWTSSVRVTARADQTLTPIELEPADGLVMLRSTPGNASVTVDGVYRGLTPLELSLPPGKSHRLTFFLNGYQEATRQLSTSAEEESSVSVTLEPILSKVRISATPPDADLYVNGVLKGKASQEVELLAASQTIEVRKDGYVPYTTTFISRPGLEQELNIHLLTLEEQRVASIRPEISVNGQTLKLIYPGNFTMGASRREAGRQANEVLRNVRLTKPFYMSVTEVSNAQYAKFNADHLSGVVQGQTLSNPNQPVVRVTWEQAARYCNWLSQQEGLPTFYVFTGDAVTSFNSNSTGYRLPTEAEWEWAARVDGDPASLLRFPWGAELPPPANQGNYADITAGNFLGRVLMNYDDGFAVSSPVASFAPNNSGFYDIGGNVAEWVHDYYGAGGLAGGDSEVDPLGPNVGTYHVIRGSSWAHGSVTELRLSFRDYNNTARDDVGFRVARYLGD